jgi:predicted permease
MAELPADRSSLGRHPFEELGRTMSRDMSRGLRLLRRTPAFTLTALLTLGLCIGANTAIFSVVDAALFRPLPYPQPERLALVTTRITTRGAEESQTGQDGQTWEAVSRNARLLDCAAFSDSASGVNLAIGDTPDYAQQQRVSAGFFRVLGVLPARGREFTPEEDRAGGPAVTVLSHQLWRQLFHADPAAVGRTLRLKGEPYVVVGILPAAFESDVHADLWTPLRPSTAGEGGGSNYGIVARPRPGVSWAAAESALEQLSGEALGHLKVPPSVAAHLHLMPLQDALTLPLRKPLLLLWGAVGLVLVIGCLNIAGLLLARATSRSREMATRAALGGGRAAIVGQLLAESLVLAILGGAVGVAFGALGIQVLNRLAFGSFALPQPVRLDARVVAMTACLSLLATLIFGLFPALRASAVDLRSVLAERGGTGIGEQRWPRRLLVVGEVALSVVLLVLAGLLIRTMLSLREIPAGFDATHVVAATLSLQDARYATDGSVNRLFTESLERIQRLPGVDSAAVSLSLPYERWLNMDFKRLDGAPGSGETEITDLTYVTPGYFAALRVPLRRGRVFTPADRQGSTQVIVINQAFARRNMRGEDPIGRHLSISGGRPREIVGVVGDIPRVSGWGNAGPLSTLPAAFIPASQATGDFFQLVHTWFSPSWIIRLRQPQEGIAAGITGAIHAVDPLLPVIKLRGMDEVVAGSLAGERFQTTLLATLAGLALVLSAVGIYGLMATTVAERGRELGIRMALGATVAQAIEAVALPGLALVLAGVAAGCLLAVLASRALRHLVWGVQPSDPLTFAAVAATLLLVAAVASLLPVLRVARLDPARALRSE